MLPRAGTAGLQGLSLRCPCETGPALRSHLKNPCQSAAPEQSWDGSADCWDHQAGPSEASCASSRPSGHCERHAAEHSGLLTSKIARHEFRPAKIGMYFVTNIIILSTMMCLINLLLTG